MLLQLTEPSAGHPKSDMLDEIALGIDLGTTYSLVGYVKNGRPYIIPVEGEETRLPSAVSWRHDMMHVGTVALTHLLDTPQHVFTSVKRLMGKGMEQDVTMHHIPESDKILKLDERSFSPVEISAEILKVLKNKAESHLGQMVEKVVITVPAYFDEIARFATRKAATLAGLEVLRIVNEPTAAVLAYGLDEKPEGFYAVYDLGGGTFDFSVLKLTRGVFQVLGTGGDVALGGDDVDHALANLLIHERQSLFPKESVTAAFYKTVCHQARFMKEQLSLHEQVAIRLEGDEGSSDHTITRDILIRLITPMIERTCSLCADVLSSVDVPSQKLQGIVLVGGSTRLPVIREMLEEHFGCPLFSDISPDEAVVSGAALQAYALTAGRKDSALLIDVTPLSLGLETMGGIVERIIERNSPIPISKAQVFTTYQDGQTAMNLHIVQGERELVQDCRSLGAFQLNGIPSMKAGLAKIEVIFTLDADGLLTVTAREKSSGNSQELQVKPGYHLSMDEMKEMIYDAYQNASDDLENRQLKQAQIRARQDLDRMTKILLDEQDVSLANALQNQVNQALDLLHTGSRDEIDAAMKSLDLAFTPLLEKRLNQLFEKTVVGKKISDISVTKD